MSKTLEHPPNLNPARPGHWRSLIAGFGLIIVAVQIIPKFLPAPFLYENRVLAGLPQLSKSGLSLKTYFDELDKYLRDQFPARSRLIASVNWVRFKLGYSHSDRVIVGKDGWLFHDDGLHLSFYRGRRLGETELAAIAKGFGDRTRQIAAAGSHFYALFPPYKPGIYPEKLPSDGGEYLHSPRPQIVSARTRAACWCVHGKPFTRTAQPRSHRP